MICVLIGRGRHSSAIDEWEAATAAGAELVEVRADCLRRDPDLKRLLAQRFTPLVFTMRRSIDGGLYRGDEEKRQRLIREAIVLGVDYVDLEMDIAAKIPRFGKTKRIISYHNLKRAPEDLADIHAKCAELNPDIIKIAVNASSLADVSRVLKIAAESKIPTIAIAMGELGAFTRVLGAKYGAPFTYAGFNPERNFAPGMPMFMTLKKGYQYDLIDKETETYAVIGDPIGHSLSPAVHNAAFRHVGINKVYVPIQVPAGRLKESLEELAWLNIRGYSVTIPHKEAIIPLLSKADGAVERIGSCNTVVLQGDEKIGHNTDYRAAMDSLEEALGGPGATEDVSPLLNKQVLILGAGGVARAIASGLSRRGAGVIITNRTDQRATELAQEVGARTVAWSARAGTSHDILINCTPVGMHPDVDDTPMPPAGYKQGAIVFDTVYHPENTMFLKLARERGCTTITGVDMFVRQAALQFQMFTGRDAPVDLMREVVKRQLGPHRDY